MSVVKGNKVDVSKLTFSDVKTNSNNGKSVYIIFIIFGLVSSSLFFNFYKEEFNNIRLSFFVDDGNITENYNYIDNYLEFLKVSIVEIARGLVYPLPAFDGNIYRKFQFLENVLVN